MHAAEDVLCSMSSSLRAVFVRPRARPRESQALLARGPELLTPLQIWTVRHESGDRFIKTYRFKYTAPCIERLALRARCMHFRDFVPMRRRFHLLLRQVVLGGRMGLCAVNSCKYA